MRGNQSPRALALLLLLAASPLRSQTPACDPLRQPQCFAWQTFAQVGANPGPATAIAGWENWPSFGNVFTAAGPQCAVAADGTPPPPKVFITSRETLPEHARKGIHIAALTDLATAQDTEIRYSVLACQEIASSGIWRQADAKQPSGLDAVFNDASKAKNSAFSLKVDPGLVVVKAKWRNAGAACDSTQFRCYWDGTNWWQLIAFHIASRALPNWFWATWEHASLAKSDPYLLNDPFGSQNGAASPAVKALLTTAKMDPVWLNYRLIGTQVSYLKPDNTPYILANSSIEPGGGRPDSCMTCHARAAYGPNVTTLAFDDENGKGYVGTPCKSWYWTGNTLVRAQTDFLWTALDSMLGGLARPACSN